MSEEANIKYSICAMIDLLGFSSHLEISAYDFRTSIGKQAVRRLQNLEEIIELLNSEEEKYEDYYPNNIELQRINDAIFLTIDLDNILIPSVGNTKFKGLSADDIDKFFSKDEIEDVEKYKSAYDKRIYKAIEPLQKFIGVVSRIHLFLNKLEGSEHFPGAKTVISTGFRRPFISKYDDKEDHFSANFALSNSFISESELSGNSFFVDNSIVQMLSHNEFARNLIRFSHFHFEETAFDCFNIQENIFTSTTSASIPDPIKLSLFRKNYIFRRLNPSPLSYLQNIPKLIPYLNDKKDPDLKNIFVKHIFNAVKNGLSKKMIDNSNPPSSFIYNGTNDLSVGIEIFQEYITTGRSQTKEDQQHEEMLKTFSLEDTSEDDDRYKEVMEFLNTEREVDIDPINIEKHKEIIFQFSESQLTSLMIMLEGNKEVLDYPYKKKSIMR